MLIIQSAKRKTKTGWQDIPIKEFSGRMFLHVFQELDGREVVAEILFAGHLIHLCGTKEWKQRMQAKEKRACTFLEAIDQLEKMCPHLLSEKVPAP